jgi:hypothetical protein
MWWGSPFAIPPGWLYCDGTAGTPDLRDRFVKCTPNVNKEGGDKGGASTYAILEENMPVHNHTFSGSGSARIQVGNHNHTFSASVTGAGSGAVSGYTDTTTNHTHRAVDNGDFGISIGGRYNFKAWDGAGDYYQSYQIVEGRSATLPDGGAHQHYFSGSASSGGGSVSGSTNSTGGFDQSATVTVGGNTGNKGGNVAVDNKPPFCEMIYLMKL